MQYTSGSGQQVLGIQLWLLPLCGHEAWCGCHLSANNLLCNLGTPFLPCLFPRSCALVSPSLWKLFLRQRPQDASFPFAFSSCLGCGYRGRNGSDLA